MSKVLLVNDSKFETMVITDILKTLRYEVKVSNESDVLDDIKFIHPDFVIINYIMKSFRGDHLIAQIKRRNPSIKCILSSSNPIQLEEFKTKRVDFVIQTPVSHDKLKEVFDKISDSDSTNRHAEKSSEGVHGKIKSGKETEENISDNRIMIMCPKCHKGLADFDISYAFCPFCGYKFRA